MGVHPFAKELRRSGLNIRKSEGVSVAKKRGNPNWGKPELNTIPYNGVTSFEEVVKQLCLSPQQYGNSVQLKDWARKNKDHKYVPSTLLALWGFEVKGES